MLSLTNYNSAIGDKREIGLNYALQQQYRHAFS